MLKGGPSVECSKKTDNLKRTLMFVDTLNKTLVNEYMTFRVSQKYIIPFIPPELTNFDHCELCIQDTDGGGDMFVETQNKVPHPISVAMFLLCVTR